jgi:hypothetical protein
MRGNLMTCILAAACVFLAIAILREPRSMPVPVTAPMMTVGTSGPMTMPLDPVEYLLDRRIAMLEVSPSMPLKEALAVVARAGLIEVQVNWPALEAATVDAVAPVNIKQPLHDITVRDALHQVLENVGIPGDIAFQVRDGTVVISTKDDLANYCIVVIYNIRDLLEDIIQSHKADASAAGPVWGHDEAFDHLQALILDTVGSYSWTEHGGRVGSIREMMGLMTIAQTPENHHDIAILLDTLRDCRHLPRAGSTAVPLSKPARPGPAGGIF